MTATTSVSRYLQDLMRPIALHPQSYSHKIKGKQEVLICGQWCSLSNQVMFDVAFGGETVEQVPMI